MREPYWSDETRALYLGDMREVIPELVAQGIKADCVLADPPFEETSLAWDRWPDGWLEAAAQISKSMWCFGSLRMFGERWGEFTAAGWKLSHETECEWLDHVVWEKQNGSGFAADRFRKVHELAAHWYRGPWRDIYKDAPRELGGDGTKSVLHRGQTPHTGKIGSAGYEDDGKRIVRSVIRCRNMQQRAIHRTQKPTGILEPLIEYACPPGGLLIDPSAGSCSSLMAARGLGRCAIGIELHEPHAEAAALWLSQMVLEAS